MKIEYVQHMGSDDTVVNAARVSMDREASQFSNDQNHKLIRYLAKHEHWTPFSHCIITLRETVPIFIARQRLRHTVGFSYNEVSRRYVDDTPEFYTPEVWRKRAENVKQGSSDEPVNPDLLYIDETFEGSFGDVEGYSYYYSDILRLCQQWYEEALNNGVAPEQARMVLPQSMYTSYYVTGSLYAFARAYLLRNDSHAQKEIRDVAKMWDEVIRPLYPVSWSELVDVKSTPSV